MDVKILKLMPLGQYYGPQANKQESGTFVMPCEKIGSGIKGYIRNLTVYNTVKEDVAKVERVNVALNKDVSVSEAIYKVI